MSDDFAFDRSSDIYDVAEYDYDPKPYSKYTFDGKRRAARPSPEEVIGNWENSGGFSPTQKAYIKSVRSRGYKIKIPSDYDGELINDRGICMSDMRGGIVDQIEYKTSAKGNKFFTLHIGGDTYNVFDKPNFGEGATVEFGVEQNGQYTNMVKGSLRVVAQNSGGNGGGSNHNNYSNNSGTYNNSGGNHTPATQYNGGNASGGTKAPAKKEVNWDRKDSLIRLQSCQNTAVATVNMLLQNEAITLKDAEGKAVTKATKMDAVIALVELEADRLFNKYTAIVDGTYATTSNTSVNTSEFNEDDIPC